MHLPTSNTGRITSLLDMAQAAQQMDIIYRLEGKLAGRSEIICVALKMAIHNKRPDREVIKTCKDNIRDNEPVMIDILGADLVSRLKSFKL